MPPGMSEQPSLPAPNDSVTRGRRSAFEQLLQDPCERRLLLRGGVGALLGMALGAPAGKALAAGEMAEADQGRLAEQLSRCHPAGDLLKALLAGNRRFAQVWRQTRGDLDPRQRMQRFAALWSENCQPDPASLARGQRPWAAVLACADSRVAPEWLFDVGPGALFDVRCAGNTAFPAGVASLEYAVAQLQVPLILVLGHSGCGAVRAALSETALTPLLQELVDPIRACLKPGMKLDQAVQANARASAASLSRQSPLLAEAVATGRLTIASAVLDLDSGLVQRL